MQTEYIVSNSLEETADTAQMIAKKVAKGGTITLTGEIGSGKTTFTKFLTEALDIHKFSVKSPTYTYIRKYKNPNLEIIHADIYRIEKHDELLKQELEAHIDSSNTLTIVEWAEKIQLRLPKGTIAIHFKYLDESSRGISISYL